jgi:hypothetical protein
MKPRHTHTPHAHINDEFLPSKYRPVWQKCVTVNFLTTSVQRIGGSTVRNTL